MRPERHSRQRAEEVLRRVRKCESLLVFCILASCLSRRRHSPGKGEEVRLHKSLCLEESTSLNVEGEIDKNGKN